MTSRHIALFLALTLISVRASSVQEFTRLTFDQNPGERVTFSEKFVDDNGQQVSLGQYFGTRPVILTMGYYECPMLCNLTLNGLVTSLQEIKSKPAQEPAVIFISVDPSETPKLAAQKKATYLRRLGRPSAVSNWHFLTGDENAIRAVAREIGFHYAYDKLNRQYAHPAGIVVITPTGKISSYVFGVNYAAGDLQKALAVASTDEALKPKPPLLMLCSKFMTLTGKYSMAILGSVRALGALTILGVFGLICWNQRRPKGGTA